MSEETPDMQYITEAEWLETWRTILSALELTQMSLLNSEVNLTDKQAGHIEGERAMLRRVLESRGVNLTE